MIGDLVGFVFISLIINFLSLALFTELDYNKLTIKHKEYMKMVLVSE